ncbi:MAG: hypothetical protein ACM3XM_05135 [Mycobacterium leprae]
MKQEEALQQLHDLWDLAHRTYERQVNLPEAMPLHVHPQSLNYGKDLTRAEGEYNRLVAKCWADGILTAADLARVGLPERLDLPEPEAQSPDQPK